MRNSHLIFVEPLASFNQQNRSPNQAANCRIWLRKCYFRLHNVKDTSDETACAQIHSKWRLVHARSWELLSGCTFPASLLCRTRAALTWANKGLIQLSRVPFIRNLDMAGKAAHLEAIRKWGSQIWTPFWNCFLDYGKPKNL